MVHAELVLLRQDGGRAGRMGGGAEARPGPDRREPGAGAGSVAAADGEREHTDHVMKYLTGSAKTYVNAAQAYVHVQDVAEAHVRVYEARDAHGRYICAESTLHRGELCRILAKLFPEYPIPTKCVA